MTMQEALCLKDASADYWLKEYGRLKEDWQWFIENLQAVLSNLDNYNEPDKGSQMWLLLLFLRTHNFKADNQRRLPVYRNNPQDDGTLRTWREVLQRLQEVLRDGSPTLDGDLKKRVCELDRILGVGIPMASAILHFCYPDTCPIIDRRVLTTLRDQAKRLEIEPIPALNDWNPKKNDITMEIYIESTKALDKLRKKFSPPWDLRDVERALWQFDSWREKNKAKFPVLKLR